MYTSNNYKYKSNFEYSINYFKKASSSLYRGQQTTVQGVKLRKMVSSFLKTNLANFPSLTA